MFHDIHLKVNLYFKEFKTQMSNFKTTTQKSKLFRFDL